MSEVLKNHAPNLRAPGGWRSRRVLIAAMVVLELVNACGRRPPVTPPAQAEPTVQHCGAEDTDKWQQPVSGSPLDLPHVAKQLGVSESQVAQGALARATCVDGISGQTLIYGEPIVIEGTPDDMNLSLVCLAYDAADGKEPIAPDATIYHVSALCPAR